MRTELRYAVVAVVLASACNAPVQELKKVVRVARRTGPQIQATVVTLRTTLQPANKATTTTIVIADDLARSTEEVGEWRLFDVKENRVAFVNDFAKTYRYESLESMRDRYDDASSGPLSDKIPRAEYAVTAERRDILGVPATKSIIKLGGYQRTIWFGSPSLIPQQLFSLMQASRAPGPDAPVSRRIDDALLSVRGFPLADHAELPYANTKIVVDRDVVSIERKNVAASLLDIPDSYREVKPAPKPRPVVPPTTTAPPATAPTTPAPTTTVPTATVPTTSVPTATVPTTTVLTTTTPATTVTTAPVPAATANVPAETGTHTETMGPPKPPSLEKKKPAVTKKSPVKKAPAKKAPAKKAPAKKAPAKTKKSTAKKSS